MKNAVIITLVFFSLLFLVPFAWNKALPFSGIFAASRYDAPGSFTLHAGDTGNVTELSTVDYLIGCLYAQIPPDYHDEALKAQAVAAHTYALRLSLINKREAYDFTDSSVTCQPYFTEAAAREHYGGEYELYYDKIKQAAEYGASRVILYSNEPIYAVYHAVSAGMTNTAHHIWGVDFPYLQSVPSDWDREHHNFTGVNEIPVSTVREKLLDFDPEIIMPLDYARWFSDSAATNAGYVIAVSARNLTISGGDLWRILNLRSTAFTIEYNGSVFSVKTKGHGHGAGLSQFGADYKAKSGYTCDEILNYYYTDINIVDVISD